MHSGGTESLKLNLCTSADCSGSQSIWTFGETYTFTYGSNLGIGDTTPDADLEISANGISNTAAIMMLSSNDSNDGDYLTVQKNGRIGVGTTTPEVKMVVSGGALCVGPDASCDANPDTEGLIYATTTTITAADYAEYFLREGDLQPGDIVGLNPETGLARYYQPGDIILGVVSTVPGVLGNNKIKDQESSPIALMGQVPFNKSQVEIVGRIVKTLDGITLGTVLNDGNMYLNISSKDSEQDREIASLKSENNELNERVNKIEQQNEVMKDILCELKPKASICTK